MCEDLIEFDTFTNAFDSLQTAHRVLEWDGNRKWKWFAISIHHALYMFCTNAIHFSNYELVLQQRGRHPDRGLFLRRDEDENYLVSSTEYVREDQPAYEIVWEETEDEPPEGGNNNGNNNEWLINIWSALARVQDGVFWMNRMVYTEPIELTDEEWDATIYLTNQIRNRLAHFVPRTYVFHIDDFRINGLHVLNIIRKLVDDSRAIDYPVDDTQEWIDRTGELIVTLNERLNA
ncbi:hypothetical protein NC796_09505 [Aliifodinibius sp. S!AR15-10]|uniref:hypothetical protein n=1 Tax=Aliifodinibius sp. S!AR15-10 TaxID=2950437 RepID=UPI00285F77BC|nr:hypothetical protein [Aliifodinibius sp. S!AR15-10]MDR8391373.1 hypothetical protein [Aliifodinibius sp. S!AR15-10]